MTVRRSDESDNRLNNKQCKNKKSKLIMPFKKINIKYENINYKIKCIKIQQYHNDQ